MNLLWLHCSQYFKLHGPGCGHFQLETKAHLTLGVKAKGQGKSRDPIGWEIKANPKCFRPGVKAKLVYYFSMSIVGLEMISKAQKEPLEDLGGGVNKGPWDQRARKLHK